MKMEAKMVVYGTCHEVLKDHIQWSLLLNKQNFNLNMNVGGQVINKWKQWMWCSNPTNGINF